MTTEAISQPQLAALERPGNIKHPVEPDLAGPVLVHLPESFGQTQSRPANTDEIARYVSRVTHAAKYYVQPYSGHAVTDNGNLIPKGQNGGHASSLLQSIFCPDPVRGVVVMVPYEREDITKRMRRMIYEPASGVDWPRRLALCLRPMCSLEVALHNSIAWLVAGTAQDSLFTCRRLSRAVLSTRIRKRKMNMSQKHIVPIARWTVIPCAIYDT